MTTVIQQTIPNVVMRHEAIARGFNRYFTGIPCREGHMSERFINGNCVQCDIDYRISHKEQIARKRRNQREREPEKLRNRWKEWAKKNPEKRAAIGRNRKARKRLASGAFTSKDIENLMELQKAKCAHAWCKKSIKNKRHIDHIVPLILGGSNDKKVICNYFAHFATHQKDQSTL